MKFSRRPRFVFLASFLVLAGVLGALAPGIIAQWKPSQAHAAVTATSAPVGQTIWLRATNNSDYVSVRIDQTNSPLQASATSAQSWEEFDVVDAGNGLIALRSHASNDYVSARIDQTNMPLQATAIQEQAWEQFTWLPQSNGTIALQSAANGDYVSARTDQTNTPLDALATSVQGWEQFTWGQVSTPGTPNLGPNVFTFDSTMPSATIQSNLDSLFNQQQTNQFGTNCYAVLFKPGTYNVNVNLGFYEEVEGLGLTPDAVNITGGVNVTAGWMANNNATQNFWRDAENMEITPSSGTMTWAVSQASPLRRVDVKGNMILDDSGGWSSGGFLADSNISGQVNSGTQQQWISRNDQWGSWTGSNWNMVFVGANNAPSGAFPNPPYTVVNQAPAVKEKPFLYIDASGNYQVFVPSLRTNSQGTSWASGSAAGTSLPISQFYIAKPGNSAATINSALAEGQNLLFTPGVYNLSSTINVTRANTVVLGLGLATLVPQNGITPMTVADVDGVSIAGILFDAGTVNSQVLLQVGPTGSAQDHSANPTTLSDVFFRIGGAAVGKATQSLVINSNNVITDDMWLWRADHGSGVGWTSNTAANGLIVNGNNVTAYGLFVEHYQQYQVIWNGNGGRTYFFQNELPYDPPTQAAWMNGTTDGYAAYKVADTVTTHEAWGVGSYCFFNVNPSVVDDHSFEVPNTAGVKFHDLVTVSLGGTGTISHIINNSGGPSNSSNSVADLVSFP